MAQIKLQADGLNLADTFTFVPLTEDNRHYRDILKWVADGNTIQEAD